MKRCGFTGHACELCVKVCQLDVDLANPAAARARRIGRERREAEQLAQACEEEKARALARLQRRARLERAS